MPGGERNLVALDTRKRIDLEQHQSVRPAILFPRERSAGKCRPCVENVDEGLTAGQCVRLFEETETVQRFDVDQLGDAVDHILVGESVWDLNARESDWQQSRQLVSEILELEPLRG